MKLVGEIQLRRVYVSPEREKELAATDSREARLQRARELAEEFPKCVNWVKREIDLGAVGYAIEEYAQSVSESQVARAWGEAAQIADIVSFEAAARIRGEAKRRAQNESRREER